MVQIDNGNLLNSVVTFDLSNGSVDQLTLDYGDELDIGAASALIIYTSADISGYLNNAGTLHNPGSISTNPYSSFGSSGTLHNSGTISIGDYSYLDNFGTLNNTGTINTLAIYSGDLDNLGTLNNEGTINNHTLYNYLTLNNTGTINNNNYSLFSNGGTINNSGTIYNQNNSLLDWGGTINNTGTIYNSSGPVNTSYSVGTLNNAGRFLNDSGGYFDNVGTIYNSGTLTNNGVMNNEGSISNTGTVLIASGATLASTGTYTQSAGATVVDGSFSSSTAIQINGGMLSGNGVIQGDVAMNGTLSPGNSPGTLTINGNYTQLAGGTFSAELAGLTPGTLYDQLVVSGTAALDGTLDVTLLNGFTVQVGDRFVLMTFADETGKFSTLNLPALTAGDRWLLSYNANNLTLSVAPNIPEPSSILLLGGGLIGIAWTLRRKINL